MLADQMNGLGPLPLGFGKKNLKFPVSLILKAIEGFPRVRGCAWWVVLGTWGGLCNPRCELAGR